MSDNGNDKISEHPKPVIEYLEGTTEAISAFANLRKIPLNEATLVLILNELRCIHYHLEMIQIK